MAVRNAAAREIVRRQFHGDPVAVHDFDTIAAEFPRHGCQNGTAGIEFYREHSSFEFLDYLTHDFN